MVGYVCYGLMAFVTYGEQLEFNFPILKWRRCCPRAGTRVTSDALQSCAAPPLDRHQMRRAQLGR